MQWEREGRDWLALPRGDGKVHRAGEDLPLKWLVQQRACLVIYFSLQSSISTQ